MHLTYQAIHQKLLGYSLPFDLLKIEIRVPIIEDMSLYGALLFGIQKEKNLSDLKTLHSFAVKQNTISYKDNNKLSLSYQNWKNLINKHF